MSRPKSRVEMLAEAFGRLVLVQWRQRTLTAICGPISTAVPILVRWSGSRKKALRAVDRLHRSGFRVRLQKLRKKSNGEG